MWTANRTRGTSITRLTIRESWRKQGENDADHAHNAATAPRSMVGGTRTQRAEREHRENTNSHLPLASHSRRRILSVITGTGDLLCSSGVMLPFLSARGLVEGTPKACRKVQPLPEAWPEAQKRVADDAENAADTSGSMIEITVGGDAEHGTHSGPTWFGLHWFGLPRFCLHRFGLHCFLPCHWSLALLPPVRFFHFSRLHVRLFLAPPLPLPRLLHLDVRLRLRLQRPLLGLGFGLGLMVEFVGVVLVVEVMVVVVVVRDRAREMGVPKRGGGGATGLSSELPQNLLPSVNKTHKTTIITPGGTSRSTTAGTWMTRRTRRTTGSSSRGALGGKKGERT